MSKKYTTNFLEDTNGSTGSANQVLVSTAAGIDWVDGSGSGIIGGPYLPLAGGTMSGDLNLTYAYPRINLTDTNNDSDYSIINNDGTFSIYDVTNNSHRLSISAAGNTTFAGKILAGSGATAAATINAYTTTVSTGLYSALRVIENTGASSYWDIGATGGASTLLNFYHNGTTTPKIFFTNLGGATFTGNVGIGTTSPSEKLHVSGGAAAIEIDSSTNEAALKYDNSTTTAVIKLANNDLKTELGGSEVTRILANGNVGIGTTNPASNKLVVAGGVDVWNSTNTLLRLGHNGTRGDIQAFASGAYGILAINSGGGNVGIGTTTPSKKLEVNGDAKVINGAILAAQAYGMNLGVSGYDIVMPTTARIAIKTEASERISILNTGNVGIGTTSPAYKLAVEGSVAVQDAQNLWIRGGRIGYENTALNNAAYIYNIGASGSSKLNIADSLYVVEAGNVGIGTTNPGYKLEVNSGTTNNIAKFVSSDGGGLITVKDSSGEVAFSNVGNDIFLKTSSSQTNQMSILNSGNVGIGTTSPLAKLHIKDGNTLSSALTNTSALVEGFNQSILQIASHSTGYSQIAFGDQNDGFDGGFIYSNASRYLAIEAANVERMRITSTGNVGIGTTSPSQKLSLELSDTSTTQSAFKGILLSNSDTTVNNGTAISFSHTAASSNSHTKIGAIYEDRTGSSEDTSLFFGTLGGGAYGERMRIDSLGNVGIGTTSPSQKLEVDGQVLSDGYRLAAMQTAPAARNSTGTLGEIVIDGNHMYVCYATNSWSRVALATSW